MRRGIFAAVALTLILVLGVVGISVASYQAGAQAGYAQGAQLDRPTDGTPSNDSRVAPYMVMPGAMMYGRGYGMPFFHPFGILGGILAILFGLFVLGVIFRVIGAMVFGRRMGWGGHGMRGGWQSGGGVPPWAEEWHRRMHEKGDASGTTAQSKTDQPS